MAGDPDPSRSDHLKAPLIDKGANDNACQPLGAPLLCFSSKESCEFLPHDQASLGRIPLTPCVTQIGLGATVAWGARREPQADETCSDVALRGC
jgi:hypothetical protein